MEPTGSFSAILLVHAPAVYGWRRGSTYLYIGATAKLFRRLGKHDILNVVERIREDDALDYWACGSVEKALILEAKLIGLHRPIYNSRFSREMDPQVLGELITRENARKDAKEKDRERARNRYKEKVKNKDVKVSEAAKLERKKVMTLLNTGLCNTWAEARELLAERKRSRDEQFPRAVGDES